MWRRRAAGAKTETQRKEGREGGEAGSCMAIWLLQRHCGLVLCD